MISRTVIVVLALTVISQAPAPSGADWRWLEASREAAFDRLMPLASGPEQLIAYRSYRDLYQDIPERYFTISSSDNVAAHANELTATLVVPVDRSIQQQLLDLRISDRQASLDSLLSRVITRRLVLGAARCPSIRTRVNALSEVSVSIPKKDVIILHPLIHRVVIDVGGAHIDATLWDPGNPIVRWAVGTADALRACSAG